MARKLTYNTNNFSGGMTDKTRDLSDLSKCTFTSHFDIYSSPEELRVMPGYEADEAYDGDPIGMRQFKPRAFNVGNPFVLVVAGEKAAGNGTKVFHKQTISTANLNAEWAVGGIVGATYSEADSHLGPRLRAAVWGRGNNQHVACTTNVNGSGFFKIALIRPFDPANESYHTGTNSLGITPTPLYGLGQQSNKHYLNISNGILSDNGTTVNLDLAASITWTGVAYLGAPSSMIDTVRGLWYLVRSVGDKNELRLWDKSSALNDYNIPLEGMTHGAVGEVGGTIVVAAAERMGSTSEVTADQPIPNGTVGYSVKTFDGYSFDTSFRQIIPTAVGSLFVSLGQSYKGSMLFYVRHATDTGATTFREGIYALGRRSPDRPIALSMLFDMSSLGRLNAYTTFGNNHYFAHHTDWKISRLQRFDTGAYDVPATYETLFYGSNTPFQKELDGVTIRSHTLPSGATIELQYRTTPDGEWTSLGTATSGKKHNFTRVGGVPIGKFQEIQFKLIATGKIVITNIDVGITETDDLPYKL